MATAGENRFLRLKTLGILPILIMSVALTRRFWNWDFDDGFIVYRYVENILSGKGWVYNAGEHYNASTSPLNTILVTLFSIFTQSIPAAAHLIGGISLMATGVSAYYLLTRSAPIWLSCAFACLLLFMMGNNFTWGLETNLFYGLLLSFICLDAYGKTSWILLGFVVLARPDAMILVMMCLARSVYLNRRVPKKELLLLAAVILPWAVFSLYYFGNVFPETLKQKVWQGASGFWGTGLIFYQGLLSYIKGTAFYHISGVYWAPVILVVPLVLTPQGIIQMVQERSISMAMLILYLVSVLLAYTVLNVPNYHWYYVGVIVIAYLSAAYGTLYVIKNFRFVDAKFLNAAGLIIAVFISGFLLSRYKADFRDLRTSVYTQLSEKINSSVDEQAKVAAAEVGVVGYLTKRKIVDIVGLTTPYGEFITGSNTDKFFNVVDPEVIVMHGPLMPHENAVFGDPRFTTRYIQKDFVAVPGYSELSFYVRGAERTFADGAEPRRIRINDFSEEKGVFKVTGGDPWVEFMLETPQERRDPVLTFSYDLKGGNISEGQVVVGRIYFAAQGEAYSESAAVPMLLRGGSGLPAVHRLSLPGAMNNKPLRIHRLRIDPIQDSNIMADSLFTVKDISLTGY